ncbi:hypothetical protein L1987_33223 [Smallanthus sonchifolius]|uniref:Uncharacterized protein n=1 Tax=Smallanthus sonchifolius TaxID=185202 RepID=A0ACB9HRN0_9ASTR|nr:hypothetical protein L1987_33223 [Smallanthus sonchifolius]
MAGVGHYDQGHFCPPDECRRAYRKMLGFGGAANELSAFVPECIKLSKLPMKTFVGVVLTLHPAPPDPPFLPVVFFGAGVVSEISEPGEIDDV